MILKEASGMDISMLEEWLDSFLGQGIMRSLLRDFKLYVKVNSRKEFFLFENRNTALKNVADKFKSVYSVGCPFIEAVGCEYKINIAALDILSSYSANKISVSDKGAELFLYGRDIFKSSILEANDSLRKDDYAVIVDFNGQPVGIGQLLYSFNDIINLRANEVVVKNILDIGLYLRSER